MHHAQGSPARRAPVVVECTIEVFDVVAILADRIAQKDFLAGRQRLSGDALGLREPCGSGARHVAQVRNARPGFRGFRRDCNRALECILRLLEPTQSAQHVAQIIMRLGKLGDYLARPMIARHGVVEPRAIHESIGQVAVRLRIFGQQFRRRLQCVQSVPALHALRSWS